MAPAEAVSTTERMSARAITLVHSQIVKSVFPVGVVAAQQHQRESEIRPPAKTGRTHDGGTAHGTDAVAKSA